MKIKEFSYVELVDQKRRVGAKFFGTGQGVVLTSNNNLVTVYWLGEEGRKVQLRAEALKVIPIPKELRNGVRSK